VGEERGAPAVTDRLPLSLPEVGLKLSWRRLDSAASDVAALLEHAL
jgi:hypothetical protein